MYKEFFLCSNNSVCDRSAFYVVSRLNLRALLLCDSLLSGLRSML
jgi:hypothetical protein